MNATENFRNAMRRAGLDYNGEIVADGKLHRFKADGDHGRNSWFVLNAGPPMVGAFGCWKRQIKETWCERSAQQLSPAEREAFRRRMEQIEAERERTEGERQAKARKITAWVLSKSTPPEGNTYLQRKGVKPFGELRQSGNRLVVPLRDANGTLHSLQFIAPDKCFDGERDKTFLRGGRVEGCFFTLSERPDGPLVIAEGYATGASVHEATGLATVAAMDCGNLPAVAKTLREKWPEREIIIAADNDAFTVDKSGKPINPGMAKGTEAAKAIGARLAVPRFKDLAGKPTDFNDLHQLEGVEAVKAQIETAEGTKLIATPDAWFKCRFPKLADMYGEPVRLYRDKREQIPRVVEICEDFMAATLGEDAQPDAPTVFMPIENKFYTYVPAQGISLHLREADLTARLSRLFLECARACREHADVSKLEFGLRDTAALAGVLRRAQSVLSVDSAYFSRDTEEFIAAANGMLRLADFKLLPFSPSYRRRNKLAVSFDPQARCPLFLDTLMRPALDDDDLNLVQRWCGLALLGENLAQRILLLTGTAGGGKGAFVRVLCGIIGLSNIASLRTELLCERFEVGRFLGRTLLYGADVPDNFLNQRSASVLKSLTGGDPVTGELKNSNELLEIICRFNAIITSNSRLTVYLEGDTDAWRRRLAIVCYNRPKPAHAITDLSERILREEGAGVLNWMLEGQKQLRADNWELQLNGRQQRRVDDLLLESNGHHEFVRRCMAKADGALLTINDAYQAYVDFCTDLGWTAITRNQFGRRIPDAVVQAYSIAPRRDIRIGTGKDQQGWKGLKLVQTAGKSSEMASETSETTGDAGFPEASEAFIPLGATEKTPGLVETAY